MKVKNFFFSLSFESYYFFWNPVLFSDINATAIEPCAKEENTAQCVLLGATCNKDLSFGFFSCRCQFPMVPSPKRCVSMLEQELLATKEYQLEISGVEWLDSLSTITSIESLLLIEKNYNLGNSIFVLKCLFSSHLHQFKFNYQKTYEKRWEIHQRWAEIKSNLKQAESTKKQIVSKPSKYRNLVLTLLKIISVSSYVILYL